MKNIDYRLLEYSGSRWYYSTISELDNIELVAGNKSGRQYKIDQMRRMARRIDEYTSSCSECEQYREEFSNLINNVELHLQKKSKEALKKYRTGLKDIQSHLTARHKLINKGHYTIVGFNFGIAIGTAIVSVMDSKLYIIASIATGLITGYILDIRARRKDRII